MVKCFLHKHEGMHSTLKGEEAQLHTLHSQHFRAGREIKMGTDKSLGFTG